MDPQAALDQALEALLDINHEDARELLEGLSGWLRKGGFAPEFRPFNIEQLCELCDLFQELNEADEQYAKGEQS